jgi:Na+/melibiose symporter-like transporter
MKVGNKLSFWGLAFFVASLIVFHLSSSSLIERNPSIVLGVVTCSLILLSLAFTVTAGWKRPKLWWFAPPALLVILCLFLYFVEHEN